MLSEKLRQAIILVKTGEKQNARKILVEILDSDPSNETAWLWFIDTLDSDSEKIIALQGFLKINPNSQAARAGLVRLTTHINKKKPAEAPVDTWKPVETGDPVLSLEQIPPASPLEDTPRVVFKRDASVSTPPVEQHQEPQTEIKPISLQNEKPSGKAKHPLFRFFARVLIILLAIFFFGSSVYLYLSQAGILQNSDTACKCSVTDAYLLRVEDRVTRWMNNQALYLMAEANGDIPQNIDFAQQLYNEENQEKVPACLNTIHNTLLLTFEYHVKYGEALQSQDKKLIEYYRNFESSMQDQLKDDFITLKNNLVCTP